MNVLSDWLSMHRFHTVPLEARRGHWIAWNWKLQTVESHVVGPGNQMSPLEEQPLAPNCWAVSQASRYFFLRPDIHNAINNLKE